VGRRRGKLFAVASTATTTCDTQRVTPNEHVGDSAQETNAAMRANPPPKDCCRQRPPMLEARVLGPGWSLHTQAESVPFLGNRQYLAAPQPYPPSAASCRRLSSQSYCLDGDPWWLPERQRQGVRAAAGHRWGGWEAHTRASGMAAVRCDGVTWQMNNGGVDWQPSLVAHSGASNSRQDSFRRCCGAASSPKWPHQPANQNRIRIRAPYNSDNSVHL